MKCLTLRAASQLNEAAVFQYSLLAIDIFLGRQRIERDGTFRLDAGKKRLLGIAAVEMLKTPAKGAVRDYIRCLERDDFEGRTELNGCRALPIEMPWREANHLLHPQDLPLGQFVHQFLMLGILVAMDDKTLVSRMVADAREERSEGMIQGEILTVGIMICLLSGTPLLKCRAADNGCHRKRLE